MILHIAIILSCFLHVLNGETCRLSKLDSRGDVAIGFPRIQNRANPIGVLNVTVLFVDFSDVPAYMSPREAFEIISPGSEQFFKAVSYGKLNMNLLPYHRWLRMTKRSTDYNMSPSISFDAQKAYITEAVNLALDSVDFSRSHQILVITNPEARAIPYGPAFCPTKGYGINIKGRVFENGVNSGYDLLYWKSFWLNHEMGHTLGLPDLYAFSGGQFRYTGDWSLMGNINGRGREFFGWERWLLGWLDDSQVSCVTSKGTNYAWLTPIAVAGGKKIVVVPLNANSAVVIESRRALGYDSDIPKPGILVYLVDSSITSGYGPIKVLPLNDNDNSKLSATLSLGKSLVYNGVTVTFSKSESYSDLVTIRS